MISHTIQILRNDCGIVFAEYFNFLTPCRHGYGTSTVEKNISVRRRARLLPDLSLYGNVDSRINGNRLSDKREAITVIGSRLRHSREKNLMDLNFLRQLFKH